MEFVNQLRITAKPTYSTVKQNSVSALSVLFVLVGLCGCASLPDVGPFVNATNKARKSVQSAAVAVEVELRHMGDDENAKQLRSVFEHRNKAYDALFEYSNSLQAIVSAGNKGAESAEKVADSVKELAGAVDLALPGSEAAIGLSIDAAKFVSNQIAIARAAKSLEQALVNADFAVQQIADMIQLDLKDLDEILVAANRAAENKLVFSYSDFLKYRTELKLKLEQYEFDEVNLDQQLKYAQLLEATNPEYQIYLNEQEAIRKSLRAGQALIFATTKLAEEWSAAHTSLITAIKERRPVNIDSLTEAAVEINELIRKVREL